MPTLEELLSTPTSPEQPEKSTTVKEEMFNMLRDYDQLNSELPSMPNFLQTKTKEDLDELAFHFRGLLNEMYQTVTPVNCKYTFDDFFRDTVSEYNGTPTTDPYYEKTWHKIEKVTEITENHFDKFYYILSAIEKLLDTTEFAITPQDIRTALDFIVTDDESPLMMIARISEPMIKEFLASIE